jgi:hypothetical protein
MRIVGKLRPCGASSTTATAGRGSAAATTAGRNGTERYRIQFVAVELLDVQHQIAFVGPIYVTCPPAIVRCGDVRNRAPAAVFFNRQNFLGSRLLCRLGLRTGQQPSIRKDDARDHGKKKQHEPAGSKSPHVASCESIN